MGILKNDNLERGKGKHSSNSKLSSGIEFPPQTNLDDSDNDSHLYTPSTFEKIVNIILCRGDLASRTLEAKPVTIVGLFKFASKWDYLSLFVGIICAVISGFSQPVLSLITGRLTNILITYSATSDEFRSASYENVYILLGIFGLLLITNFIQYMCFQVVCTRIIAQMRHRYLKAILRQNAGWLDKNHCGTLTTRLNDDMERIREGIGDKLGLLVRGAAMFIGAMIISFIYQWRLAFLMLGVAPATCVCMSLMARKMSAKTSKELSGVGKAGSIAEESILGVRTVQAFNGQEEMVERYSKELRNGKKYAVEKGFWSGFYGGLFFFILDAFLGCGMLYGAYLLRVGIIDNPGEIFIVVMSLLLGAYFLGLVSPHMMVLLNARVAAAKIYQIIERVPLIDLYSEEGKRPKNIDGKVHFDNVNFSYPTRKGENVLNGLNVCVQPGQTIAFVGHSGCGKSTAFSLLNRLYDSDSGEIYIDEWNVRELNIGWLRKNIGIVQQEPVLFNGTVEENLLVANQNLTESDMVTLCKTANAHDFIMKLPEQYKTVIGDGGIQLSGGQKQRVAIARTLASNPKILLLDEATSALDAKSEGIVQAALNNASKGRTTLVIAHRLSTIRDADQIVVFEKGIVKEMGTHDELVAAEGKYSQLVKAQQFQAEETSDESRNGQDEISDLHPSQLSRIPSLSIASRNGDSAFRRGSKVNDSFSNRSTTGKIDAEYAAFMETVKETYEKDSKTTAGYWDIVKNSKGQYTMMTIGLVWAIIRGLELPALSLAYRYAFQGFQFLPYTNGDMMHRLCMSVIVHCAIGVGCMVSQLVVSVVFASFSEELTIRFRVLSFKSILHQDAAYFDNPLHTPGQLVTRLASDSPNIKAVLDGRMQHVVSSITTIIANIIIGFVFSWQVAILGSGALLLLFAIMVALGFYINKRSIDLIKKDDAGRLAVETIENVKTIQLLTGQTIFYKRYEEASKRQKWNEVGKAWFEAINFTIGQSFLYFMTIIVYALGIHIINTGQKSSEDVYSAITAMLLGSFAVMNASPYFPEFVKARAAAAMLFSIIDRTPKIDIYSGKEVIVNGEIELDRVRFQYPQRPLNPIMNGMSFSVKRGETIALVGPSGCGKSTIISLIERFYEIPKGCVLIDGNDLKSLSLHNLRSQIGLVGQEPRLFAGTIRENIGFGMKEITNEQIQKALIVANADGFVNGLPNGMETEVGEKGTQMSGGQKQRIAIARALVRDPKILLLDEATSALDSESEKAVQEALDRARAGRTCITIAHRLSSIQNADLIVYVEHGKVIEMGTHHSLMSQKGRYFRLAKEQDLTSTTTN